MRRNYSVSSLPYKPQLLFRTPLFIISYCCISFTRNHWKLLLILVEKSEFRLEMLSPETVEFTARWKLDLRRPKLMIWRKDLRNFQSLKHNFQDYYTNINFNFIMKLFFSKININITIEDFYENIPFKDNFLKSLPNLYFKTKYKCIITYTCNPHRCILTFRVLMYPTQ